MSDTISFNYLVFGAICSWQSWQEMVSLAENLQQFESYAASLARHEQDFDARAESVQFGIFNPLAQCLTGVHLQHSGASTISCARHISVPSYLEWIRIKDLRRFLWPKLRHVMSSPLWTCPRERKCLPWGNKIGTSLGSSISMKDMNRYDSFSCSTI